jgi:hypothetical protein
MDIKHPTKNNGRKRCVGANILTWNLEIIRNFYLLIMCLRITKHKEITHYLQLQLGREGTMIDVN